jgi:hypothetical protein
MYRIWRATAGSGPGLPRVRLLTPLVGLGILSGLALAGCQPSGGASTPSSAPAQVTTISPSPGLSVPGTHKSATVYRISSSVSTVVVTTHVGNITVTGGSGSSVSVTQQVTYSKTPPVTTRTISGKTLTVTYSCPAQVVCAVAYVIQVPRDVTVQAQASAGAVRLAGLAGNVTAKAKIGFINATGLSGASVSLTTDGGGITASFAVAPGTLQAVARIGTITLDVPGTASYKVSADARVGHADVGVRQNSSSDHVITATTDVGTIKITASS